MEQLRKDGYEVMEQFYEPDQLGAALRDFDVVIIRSATKIKEPQIDAAKGSRLKLIIRAGVGVDNIAVKYAEEHGIQVKNTPRASSNAVAELALALLFSCARNISIAGPHHAGEQVGEERPTPRALSSPARPWASSAMAGSASWWAPRAQALGMNVLSVVHCNKPEGCECETMHFVTMDELLSQSDIIVLCAPSGDKPLVDAESLAKMKDGVVIINVSRGANVDEAALLDALNSGKVKAAGLDVWLSEKDPNWALASHPAVSCTPHIGAGTKEAQKRIGAELVDIVENFG